MSELKNPPVPGPYRYPLPQGENLSARVADFRAVVIYSTLGLATGTGMLLGLRYLVRKALVSNEEKHSAEEGYPANYAKRFKMAFENDNWLGWGTNLTEVFNALNDIPTKAMYRKVQEAYNTLYKKPLNADLEDELSSDEYNRFVAILSNKKEK